MRNIVTAVLIDTISIQSYIFSSNKLKENIGASHLVEQIYDSELTEALKQTLGIEININEWKQNPAEIQMLQKETLYETGFIGGGNALLFFRDDVDACAFIKQWSFNLLHKAPDLKTAVAVLKKFNFEHFKEHLGELYKQLTHNKNCYFPNTTLHKHGITADDASAGYGKEVSYNDPDKIHPYRSSSAKAKLDAAELSQRKMVDKYHSILSDQFTFTNRVEQLGQREGHSYLSIVHIDGNRMGERFKKCTNLEERRKLSLSVDKAANESMEKMLGYVVGQMSHLMDKVNGFDIQTDQGKHILPIRPLVLAGDDVTFIAEGRLGVHLAEKYIHFFAGQTSGFPSDSSFSSCAGVSIVKTRYPFYQAYKMSESLCQLAKKDAYSYPETSWLDFHISSGGFFGDLHDIREQHYKVGQDNLHFGPYLISTRSQHNINQIKDINSLKDNINQFASSKEWPNSIIKELRTALSNGKEATEIFINEMKPKRTLPSEIKQKDYSVKGWRDQETPYYDVIELMDFYPPHFIEGSKEYAGVGNPN